MRIITLEPVLRAYFTNRSHQSVSIHVSPIVARERLGKNVTAATNTHARIVERVVSFAVLVVLRKVGD
jgi:hypothetical protein